MLAANKIVPYQCQAARALLGWSQAKLASLAEVPRSAVSRFENGESIDITSLLSIKCVLEAADIEFTTRADGASGISLSPRVVDPQRLA